MYLMVLDDGETYSLLNECKIVKMADDIESDDPSLDEMVKGIAAGAVSKSGYVAVVFGRDAILLEGAEVVSIGLQ